MEALANILVVQKRTFFLDFLIVEQGLRVFYTGRSGPLNIGAMHVDKNATANHTVLKLKSKEAKA